MTQAELIIRGLVEEIAKNENYEDYTTTIEPMSSGGANFSSHLFAVILSAPGKDDLNLCVKMAALGATMRASVPATIYTQEHYFYTNLIKKYRHIEEKYNVPTEDRLFTAKFYAASSEYMHETLVLENLTASGFESFDRFQSIGWAYASYCIKQLAIFHALSIAFSKEDPAGYESTVKSKLTRFPIDIMTGSIEKALDKALNFIKEENKGKLLKFLENSEIRQPLYKLFKDSELPVIIHSDFRPSNMMHKVQTDGTVQVITLDYQTLQQGCPVVDLLMFILFGSDKQYRDQYWQKSLDSYYDELSAALIRFKLDPNEIYSKETYQQDTKELLPYMLSYSLLGVLVTTVGEDDAPSVDEDFVIDSLIVRASSLYVERMNDLVEDCIAMGVL